METLARPLARNKLAGPCESSARFAARCESYSAEFFFSPAGALSHENHAGGLGGARLPVHIYPAGCFLPERGDMCVQHTKKNGLEQNPKRLEKGGHSTTRSRRDHCSVLMSSIWPAKKKANFFQ